MNCRSKAATRGKGRAKLGSQIKALTAVVSKGIQGDNLHIWWHNDTETLILSACLGAVGNTMAKPQGKVDDYEEDSYICRGSGIDRGRKPKLRRLKRRDGEHGGESSSRSRVARYGR